ncbi:hypothetical protein [Blastomonas sp. SL216]|uniref:hypothetical protein n=1 Tax=Blastomonas sp. SL216 TaxID=2995169 RepID=UPI0023770317|nr:hypothetical protein OU999_00085 [Blastomonas sp. SL216]
MIMPRHLVPAGLMLALSALMAGPALAELPAPVLVQVSPAENTAASVPVTELRFEFADDVHLFNVQMVKIFEEREERYVLFQTGGAYIRARSFVFPLQQPITRDGTYRIQVMAQPVDNGQSLSTVYEFTVGAPTQNDPAAE